MYIFLPRGNLFKGLPNGMFSLHDSGCLSVCLSVCLFVCLSVCPSVRTNEQCRRAALCLGGGALVIFAARQPKVCRTACFHYMVEDVCLSVCPKLLFVTFFDNLKNAVHSEWEQRAERHYSLRHER